MAAKKPTPAAKTGYIKKIVAKSPEQAKTQNSGLLRSGMSKKTAKTGDTPVGKAVAKKVISTAKGVAKRAKVVGREARDVVTAAGTVAQTRITSPRVSKMAGENLKKQVREVGTAIKSGKKGTTSDKTVDWDVVVRKNEAGRKVYKKPYTKGTQR